jgi:hypothetical protein
MTPLVPLAAGIYIGGGAVVLGANLTSAVHDAPNDE